MDPPFPDDDGRWMRQALELAARGRGLVEPNPMVGCVLVAGDKCIGTGFHDRYGGLHAERAAIDDARQQGNGSKLAGCTAVVTLEPCCHHGKTPPCTDALLEVGVARLVVAMLDPFEEVSGKGVEQIRGAGVVTQIGLEESAARELNSPYLKRISTQRPWVIAKWAMSMDGKIATRDGSSKWISGEASRKVVHLLRGRVDAILVGIATAVADDPLLTARAGESPLRLALRVVADSRLSLPTTSRLVQTAKEFPTLIWAGPDADRSQADQLRLLGCTVEICSEIDPLRRLDLLLRYLYDRYRATNLLVEGGGKLLGSLLDLHQIDQCEVFIAPKLLGGAGATTPMAGIGFGQVDESPTATITGVHQYESATSTDLHISSRLTW